ncbi:MAG: hypothetical protein Q8Q54_15080, partial [Methylococcales bacterium]|nr:hypothetical protein [Methylococcales bacterium]
MNNEEYFNISELEQAGKTKEGFALLARLVDEKHPLALLDISCRCYSTDIKKSEEYAVQAKEELEKLSSDGDGEAKRMLAEIYLG